MIISFEQNPASKSTKLSANQNISRILWNPKVRLRVQKVPLNVSNLTQMTSVHNFPFYFFETGPTF
jgi:hypothetical protein